MWMTNVKFTSFPQRISEQLNINMQLQNNSDRNEGVIIIVTVEIFSAK